MAASSLGMKLSLPQRAPSARRPILICNDLFLEILNKRDHGALFSLGHLELRQGCGGMAEEHVPVALADAHAPVGEHHVPAAIVHRSARARAEEIDEKLLLAHDAVFPAMRPEPPELRIGPEPGQQIIRHRRNRGVPTKALIKGLRTVAHRVLLKSEGTGNQHPTSADLLVFVVARYSILT